MKLLKNENVVVTFNVQITLNVLVVKCGVLKDEAKLTANIQEFKMKNKTNEHQSLKRIQRGFRTCGFFLVQLN